MTSAEFLYELLDRLVESPDPISEDDADKAVNILIRIKDMADTTMLELEGRSWPSGLLRET